jgi:hypothetical protein
MEFLAKLRPPLNFASRDVGERKVQQMTSAIVVQEFLALQMDRPGPPRAVRTEVADQAHSSRQAFSPSYAFILYEGASCVYDRAVQSSWLKP